MEHYPNQIRESIRKHLVSLLLHRIACVIYGNKQEVQSFSLRVVRCHTVLQTSKVFFKSPSNKTLFSLT